MNKAIRCLLAGAAGLLALTTRVPADELADPEAIEFFETAIRPIFVNNCQVCHGEKKEEAGLRLTSRELLSRGSASGPVVVPGKPGESLLLQVVTYQGDVKMPPKGKLPDAEIEKLKHWIALGAPWPDEGTPSAGRSTREFQITEAQRQWWAFQPVKPIVPPSVVNSAWVSSPIDQFILAKLESLGIPPATPADKRTLIRRATFDLTGIPPTLADVDAFLRDDSASAFDTVVDRLLASSAYGQRWARHWLDVVRYADYYDADAKTRVASCESTEAWRYRDWVVDTLNVDFPFDQFIVHQIAGDLLPSPVGDEIYPAGLIATTFLANGVWDRGDADKEKMVSDMVDDNIDTVGKAFLGVTLGCARCHDHKFDPISQEDYYALAGIFYSSHFLKELGTKGGEYTMNRVPLVPRSVAALRDKQVLAIESIQTKLAALDKRSPPVAADDSERLMLVKERDMLQRELPPPYPLAMAVQEGGMPGGLFPNIQDVPIHIRGSYTRLGATVQRRLPKFLAGDSQSPITGGSGRRELVGWVASKENPLTARVIVNRVWQWHFGEGLVRTPSNFGMRSEPPTHPELLDWLAARFVEDGWSLKKLHRRLMLSATYQQASAVPRESLVQDPENYWLGRFSARRLEAEAIRDAMLFTTGDLDLAQGGPASDELNILRRSLYVQSARWDRSNFATLFDAANSDASTDKRYVSTVAPQSLFLLHHDFALGQAKHLAERLSHDAPNDEMGRIQHAYKLLFSRPATVEEIDVCRQVLTQTDGQTAWVDLAHVLLCSNEFVYLD